MKLSELQRKDIIDIKSGKKVGRIIDVEFDQSNGYMIKFIIERAHFVKSLFSQSEELSIKFTQIKKMGEDVVLIDIN
ncbi:MAG: YlmC/YmxH family sporulation protein [Bacilli bacterium]|nr:YlmC/YmxH family sporulation protein [Bacilli bacterium]